MERQVTMRIGELAGKTGVSVRSLRYYEEQGLLTSSRSPSGQRCYTSHHIDRVAYIQQMYAAGLSSSTILEVLPCSETPSAQTSETALNRLIEERDRLEASIAGLIHTREMLDGLIDMNRAHRASMDDQHVA